MKATIAQCPVICGTKDHASTALPVTETLVSEKAAANAQVTALATKAFVVVSGSAMIYGIISYGQIFHSYLQW
jgi:hypothetical protein